MPRTRRRLIALTAVAVGLGLGGVAAAAVTGSSDTDMPPNTTTTTAMPSTTTTAPTTTTTMPADRPIGPEAHAPLARVGDLVLLHPSARVERVGFHESSLDGALELAPEPSAVAPTVLPTRKRGHGPQTAVDVVSDPAAAVTAPVTGVVLEARAYQLYCREPDDVVLIVPDGHPELVVRVLHIEGVRVVPGWRVTAGETVLAARPRPLPFRSQIDDLSAGPTPWPHVHLEVDDVRVPDTPSDGDSC